MADGTLTPAIDAREMKLSGERLAVCIEAACEIEHLTNVLASTDISGDACYLVRGLALRIHDLNGVILGALFDDEVYETSDMQRAVFGMIGAQSRAESVANLS